LRSSYAHHGKLLLWISRLRLYHGLVRLRRRIDGLIELAETKYPIRLWLELWAKVGDGMKG
jgi:hypothetical protein